MMYLWINGLFEVKKINFVTSLIHRINNLKIFDCVVD